jgi:hypothetical protein
MGIYPLVGRVEGFGDVLVGDDLGRQIASGPQYAYAHSFFLSEEGVYHRYYIINMPIKG